MNKLKRLALLVLLSSITGCSEGFRKIQKSKDWKVKYEAAVNYYNKEKYYKSTVLFREILPLIRGSKEAELASYYLAYAHFNQGQFQTSYDLFHDFVLTYNRSEHVMEAHYLFAYSLYKLSPYYQLDQAFTYDAISSFQGVIDRYPDSEYAKKSDKLIAELQIKLEKKVYNHAKHYHKLRQYKAAVVSLENFRKKFPDSDYNEEIYFLKVESSYLYATQSTSSKQEKRYRNTLKYYDFFINKYEDSKYLRKAEDIFDKTKEELRKLASQD